jgi:hypothetical protein
MWIQYASEKQIERGLTHTSEQNSNKLFAPFRYPYLLGPDSQAVLGTQSLFVYLVDVTPLNFFANSSALGAVCCAFSHKIERDVSGRQRKLLEVGIHDIVECSILSFNAMSVRGKRNCWRWES